MYGPNRVHYDGSPTFSISHFTEGLTCFLVTMEYIKSQCLYYIHLNYFLIAHFHQSISSFYTWNRFQS